VSSRLPHLSARRLATLVCAIPLALVLAACGHKLAHPTTADSEGVYVDAGPVTYQVQVSRQLNPFSTEDRWYLVGQSSPPPTPQQEWFAVFMWAKNQTSSAANTTDRFDIVDTQGNRYFPIPLNPAANPFAWTARTLQPNGTEPAPDSVASNGPTQGSELLFKINDSAYSNRPLMLQIYAAGQLHPSTVSLDL
jgi:hypothetical protein